MSFADAAKLPNAGLQTSTATDCPISRLPARAVDCRIWAIAQIPQNTGQLPRTYATNRELRNRTRATACANYGITQRSELPSSERPPPPDDHDRRAMPPLSRGPDREGGRRCDRALHVRVDDKPDRFVPRRDRSLPARRDTAAPIALSVVIIVVDDRRPRSSRSSRRQSSRRIRRRVRRVHRASVRRRSVRSTAIVRRRALATWHAAPADPRSRLTFCSLRPPVGGHDRDHVARRGLPRSLRSSSSSAFWRLFAILESHDPCSSDVFVFGVRIGKAAPRDPRLIAIIEYVRRIRQRLFIDQLRRLLGR